MRTTVDLNDELLIKARRLAAQRSTTLTAVIEESLAAALARTEGTGEPFRLLWQPHRGRYIGGVDLADRDALYETMERQD